VIIHTEYAGWRRNGFSVHAGQARALQAWLRPGDALHIPAGWLHYVETDTAPPWPAGGAAAGPPAPRPFWLAMSVWTACDATVKDML
jgi:hypothetical protein